jgi:hypothetical protein
LRSEANRRFGSSQTLETTAVHVLRSENGALRDSGRHPAESVVAEPYLLLFSGEAHNVEVGITNELFQIERGGAGTSRSASAA